MANSGRKMSARKRLCAGALLSVPLLLDGNAAELPTRLKDDSWARLASEVAWIEAHLQMPRGVEELTRYDRYYAWVEPKRDAVHIVMELRAKPGIHLVAFEDLPFPRDGHCEVIHARVEAHTHRVERIECNSGA